MAGNELLLTILEQKLARVHPLLLKNLNDGLTIKDIDKISVALGVTFTTDVYDMFSWKNGVRMDGSFPLTQKLIFPTGIPFSLSEAVDRYNLLALSKHFIEPNYFPLFSNGKDDVLLIDLDQDSDTYSMMSLYSPALLGNNGSPVTIYDSFSLMLQTILECYNKNAYWIDQDNLQVDNDLRYDIACQLNPGSQFWQYM